MSRDFCSADYHCGHGKIIEYANRPYKTSTEMNEAIIRNHNMRIKPEDRFFHIGDFVFKSGPDCPKADDWLQKLNGHKIMIRGNHDNNNSLKTVIDCVHLTFANRRINMVHKPEHANPDFDINLVGHVHQAWRIRTFKQHYDIIESVVYNNADKACDRQDLRRFLETREAQRNSNSVLLNVGLDVQNYMPITLDEAVGQVTKFQRIGV